MKNSLLKNMVLLTLFLLTTGYSLNASDSTINIEGQITDPSDLLTNTQKSELLDRLDTFENNTSFAIYLLIIETTPKQSFGELVNSLTTQIEKKRPSGDFILIYIEALTKEIQIIFNHKKIPGLQQERLHEIVTTMVPDLNKKQYAEGINAGIDTIEESVMKVIQRKKPSFNYKPTIAILIAIFIVFILIFLKAKKSKSTESNNS